MRRFSTGFLVAVSLVLGLAWLHDAKAEWVWQQAGPPGAGEGLSALAIDKDNPDLIYFAGNSTVWVSDDGGETFNIVVQLARSLTRRSSDGDSDSDDEWNPDDESDDETPERLDQNQDMSRTSTTTTLGDDEPNISRREKRMAAKALSKRQSITRLRIIRDRVYVCGARGLVSFPRHARSYTIPRTEWMGRKSPVLDVAPREDGGLWVATSNGLYEVDKNGTTRSVAGTLSQDTVTRLVMGKQLLIGSESGVWSASQDGLIRVAALPRRRVIRDMLVYRSNLWVLTKDQLLRFDQNTFALREIISLFGGHRLAVGRDLKLWIAADSGVWTLGGSGSLEPARAGLSQALFKDIVSTSEGAHPLWVAGRGGAWRLTTEIQRVLSERARKIDGVLKNIPSAYAVIEQVQKLHRVHEDQLEQWRNLAATSWMLPKVDLNYIPIRRRVEWLSFLPTLGTYVIDEVRVLPVDDEFRVIAHWELFPPLFALLDRGIGGQDSGFSEEVKRSYLHTERLRRRTSPLYAAWIQALVKVKTSTPNNIRRALRERLELRRLSADLDAITGGHFSQFSKISQGEHL